MRVHYTVGGATLYKVRLGGGYGALTDLEVVWNCKVSQQQLPHQTILCLQNAHWETSCKVYAAVGSDIFHRSAIKSLKFW